MDAIYIDRRCRYSPTAFSPQEAAWVIMSPKLIEAWVGRYHFSLPTSLIQLVRRFIGCLLPIEVIFQPLDRTNPLFSALYAIPVSGALAKIKDLDKVRGSHYAKINSNGKVEQLIKCQPCADKVQRGAQIKSLIGTLSELSRRSEELYKLEGKQRALPLSASTAQPPKHSALKD